MQDDSGQSLSCFPASILNFLQAWEDFPSTPLIPITGNNIPHNRTRSCVLGLLSLGSCDGIFFQTDGFRRMCFLWSFH